MTWLRSRRFYAGLLLGLALVLLVAAQQGPSSEARDDRAVVVRTYNACPDGAAAARTAALVEAAGPNGVVVETFSGCCGGCGDCGR